MKRRMDCRLETINRSGKQTAKLDVLALLRQKWELSAWAAQARDAG